MPTYQMRAPDGQTYRIEGPEGATDEQVRSEIIRQNPQLAPQPSMATEIVGGAATGLARFATGMAGLPALASDVVAAGMRKGAAALGVSPERIAQVDAARQNMPFDIAAPRAETLQRGLESVTGPLYQPQTLPGRVAETVGEFAPLGMLGPGGLARRALAGVAAPAAGAQAATEVTAGTPYEPYARVAGGVAGAMTPGALARVITPAPASATRLPFVRHLQAEGVEPSAGQITGSRPMQYFESVLGDIPGAGGKATAMAEKTAEQFTTAALRKAGITGETRATPQVMDRAFGDIGQKYDTLAARHTIQPDPQMGNELRTAIDDYRAIVSPPNQAPAIANFESEVATAMAKNNGVIPGDVYQSLRSRLERTARGAPSEVADTLRDMKIALDDAMERTLVRQAAGQALPQNHAIINGVPYHLNPNGTLGSPVKISPASPAAATAANDLGAWRDLNRQYRSLLTIEKATTGAGAMTAEGFISPSQLRNAVVQQGRRAYARGQSEMGELARAGEVALKPLPQSGTGPRMYAQGLMSLLGGTTGALFSGGNPLAAMAAAAGAAAAPAVIGRTLMTPAMQRYLANQVLAQGPRTPISPTALAGLLSTRQNQ